MSEVLEDSQKSGQQELKTDATVLNISTLFTSHAFLKTSSQLTDVDLRRFFFLCDELLKGEDRRSNASFVNGTISSESDPASNKLVSILEKSTGRNQELQKRLLVELLYLTKKHKFLKLFGKCKHNLEKEKDWLVSPFRRCLFEICEDITDEDLQVLNIAFSPNNSVAPTAEDLMETLLAQGVIERDNFEPLEKKFTHMHRDDLKEKIELYIKETTFYDLSPVEPGGKCGLAVIFNHYKFDKKRTVEFPDGTCPKKLSTRKGTHVDKENLKELFQQFNFEVVVHDDLLNEKFKTTLMKYSEEPASRYKIFVLCILSHGDEGLFYTSDRAPIYLSEVWEAIGQRFLSWDGKPKLIFIQACRGDKCKAGAKEKISVWRLHDLVTDAPRHDSLLNSPPDADMLIGNSTVPGFVSYRQEKEGSFYIAALTKILKDRGHREDLIQNLTEVNNLLAAEIINDFERQMPTFHSQLRKKLKFQQKGHADLEVSSRLQDTNTQQN